MAIAYFTHHPAGAAAVAVATILLAYYIIRQVQKDALDKQQLRLFGIVSLFVWGCALITSKLSMLIKIWMVESGIVTNSVSVGQINSISQNLVNLIFTIDFGAMTVLPGLVAGSIILLFVYRKQRAEVLSYLDYWAVGLALFLAIYRLQCFFHGCCYGSMTDVPWGVVYEGSSHSILRQWGGYPRHPVQLYESIGAFVMFIILYEINRRKSYDGQASLMWLLLYPALRFFMEIFRWKPYRILLRERIGDKVYYFGLTLSQVVCAILFLLGIGILVYLYIKKRRKK